MRSPLLLAAPLLFASGVMLALAAGPALAQNALESSAQDDPAEHLSDPVPVARPLYSPSAATASSAVESPAAGRTASAGSGRLLPCSPLNPCAVAPPLPPVKAG
jgi:hypothetical protein